MDKHCFMNQERLETRSTTELIGIAKGLIADGKLNEQEVDFLCSWLSNNTEYYNTFPFSLLFDRIETMLSDNVIDENERQELFEFLKELTGGEKVRDEIENFSTSLPLTRPCPKITIPHKSFCLTGTFLCGQRKECEKKIEELGGYPKSGITLDLDYLIIGSKPTRDWKYSSFGNKIIKAMEYNENKKGQIAIISEKDWLEAINNTPAIIIEIKQEQKKKRSLKDPLEGMILE